MPPKSKCHPNAILQNKEGHKFIVLELVYEKITGKTNKKNRFYRIRFLETNFTTIAESSTLLKGEICDYSIPNIYGVACFGNAKTHKNYSKQAYTIYNGIIRRCYDTKYKSYKNYGGNGVRVCDRWLNFENFLEDLDKIEGYDKQLFEKGKIHLDKDKKSKEDKKIYSLETCCFLTPSENSILANKSRRKIKKIATNTITGEKVIFYNTKEFAEEYNLNESSINNYFRSNWKQYKGWTFEKEEI